MLHKSHPLRGYNEHSDKNKEKYLMHFDPDARVIVLSNCHKIQLCDKFSSVIFVCFLNYSLD